MSRYLLVFSNIASFPSIMYFLKRKKYYISLQILFTAFFSFLHHLFSSGLVYFSSTVFTNMDLLYSYWLIYTMQMYLFFPYSGTQVCFSRHIVYPILVLLSLIELDSLYNIFITFFIGLLNLILISASVVSNPEQQYFKINVFNIYFCLLTIMITINIYVFWQAYSESYELFHSLHHILCFSLPIIIDRYIVSEEKKRNTPVSI